MLSTSLNFVVGGWNCQAGRGVVFLSGASTVDSLDRGRGGAETDTGGLIEA
jgi:hypothetical protein